MNRSMPRPDGRQGSRRTAVWLLIAVVAVFVLRNADTAAASRLLQMQDSTNNYIAATHITSTNSTGWNDPTLYLGDLVGFQYHVLFAIKDTLRFQTLFSHCTLDSARLSLVVSAKAGAPGNLDFHIIKRDTVGMGVYPAYDDNGSQYCRSSWKTRKGALPTACPDSINWQTPGATGPDDYHSAPFATVVAPHIGARYDIDVTQWIEGVINGIDSVSNGILVLASNENAAGTDYFGIRNIWPFYNGNDRMHLNIWVSDWDWIKVRLDSLHVDDGWIASDQPDTIISDDGYLRIGTDSVTPIPNAVGMIFPDDTTLFGANAIPAGYTIDSARLWLYAGNTFPVPNDTIAIGDFATFVEFFPARFPTWDSAGDGFDWINGSWSANDVIRRDIQYVNAVNAWYSWSVGSMIARWADSATTRHGFALWDTGPSSNAASAWIDRSQLGFGARAGSLLVWISPPLPSVNRAWLDCPSPLK